jgi:hypothetical protein
MPIIAASFIFRLLKKVRNQYGRANRAKDLRTFYFQPNANTDVYGLRKSIKNTKVRKSKLFTVFNNRLRTFSEGDSMEDIGLGGSFA